MRLYTKELWRGLVAKLLEVFVRVQCIIACDSIFLRHSAYGRMAEFPPPSDERWTAHDLQGNSGICNGFPLRHLTTMSENSACVKL